MAVSPSCSADDDRRRRIVSCVRRVVAHILKRVKTWLLATAGPKKLRHMILFQVSNACCAALALSHVPLFQVFTVASDRNCKTFHHTMFRTTNPLP
jgi:hypothetical protein